jgi:hypothetical protein
MIFIVRVMIVLVICCPNLLDILYEGDIIIVFGLICLDGLIGFLLLLCGFGVNGFWGIFIWILIYFFRDIGPCIRRNQRISFIHFCKEHYLFSKYG